MADIGGFQSDGSYDGGAGIGLADSAFAELAALPSFVRSFEFSAGRGPVMGTGSAIASVSSTKPSAINMFQPVGSKRPSQAAAGPSISLADFSVDDQLVSSASDNLTLAHTFGILFHTDNPASDQVVLGSYVDGSTGEFLQVLGGSQTIRFVLGNRGLDQVVYAGWNFFVCSSDGAGTIKMWSGVGGGPAPYTSYQESTAGNNLGPTAVPWVLGALNTGNAAPYDGQVAWLFHFNADIFASGPSPTALALAREHAYRTYGLSFG